MSLIYKSGTYYGNGGGGSGGHSIKDNGVDMDARAALNFVDFDLTDNSGDDETDVAAHRLTSDEMAEIMSTLPGTPTELPVLFDEQGTERQVGWYVNSQGLKKPVYEKHKSVYMAKASSGTPHVDLGVFATNMDKVCYVDGVAMYSTGVSTSIFRPFTSTTQDFNVDVTDGKIWALNTNYDATYYMTVRYTKTTDTYQ